MGHQKALAGALVGYVVTIADQIVTLLTHFQIPDKLEQAVTGLLVGLTVWAVPHGGAEEGEASGDSH